MRAHRSAGLLAVTAAATLLVGCSATSTTSSGTPASSATAASSTPVATSASASASSSASTSTPPSASASATAAASATPKPSPTPTKKPTHDRAIRGTWHADAASIITTDPGALSSRRFTQCTGPVVLTFTAQGGLVDQGQITCTGRGATGHGQFSSTGRYTADGTLLVVTHAVTRCTLSVAGVAARCSFAYSNGTAHYRVSGAHLTITFRTPSGTRTQTYVR